VRPVRDLDPFSLLSTMNDLTQYNASTKQSGPLNGDTTARAIQNQISNSLRAVRNSDFGEYKTLSDIGVQFQKDGTLKVNDTALNNALANPTRLATFFAATATDPTAQGFAVRVNNVTSQLLGTSGTLQTRTDGLHSQVTRLQKQEADENTRLVTVRQRLTNQYAALDAQLQTIQSTSDALTSAFAALNAQTSSK